MRSANDDGNAAWDLRRLGFGVLGFTFCALLTLWSNHRYSESGWQGDDFAEFYAAGELAGTGDLYDSDAIHSIETSYHSGSFSLPYLRLPFEAWLLKSLAAFPYSIARAIWHVTTTGAVILAMWLWPLAGAGRKGVTAGWFFPVANCIVCGQDAVFVLLFAAFGAYFLRAKREWLAGAALGCCFFKFHLGIGIAVMLLATLRWRVIAAAAFSAGAQIGASFIVEPGWLAQYVGAIREPGADRGIVAMPNIRGLCSWWPHYGPMIGISLAVVVLAAVLAATRKQDATLSVALALAAGVLVAPHCFVYDWVVVLPLIARFSGRHHQDLRRLALLLSFPPLYELPYLTNLSAMGFAVTQLAAVGALSVLVMGASFPPDSGRSDANAP
jgi:hypothetical protein